MRWIGFYDYTVILTYLSLFSGLIGMKNAADGRLGAAIVCLLVSGFCDLFDGVVARSKKGRTEDEKNFGIQLDSLCDIVCFGVFPAVFLCFSGMDSWFGIVILLFYVLCALIRLAFFNVLEINRQRSEGGCAKGYRGLPVTSAAITFPVMYAIGLAVPQISMGLYYAAALLSSLLFIADFHVPKLDIAKLFRRSDDQKQDAL